MYVTPPQLIDCETTFGILESIFTKSKKTATDISSWEFRDGMQKYIYVFAINPIEGK
ncbi:unnamed protein product [Arabidopsis thaliana]|uniref:Uncharacterized protein n=1 Tax=Arabidopsis thaliana TaxID=3702 RepID=A0A5S9YFP5_ARATH|nr:unnamed protein product [Arabidopsis thaliana]